MQSDLPQLLSAGSVVAAHARRLHAHAAFACRQCRTLSRSRTRRATPRLSALASPPKRAPRNAELEVRGGLILDMLGLMSRGPVFQTRRGKLPPRQRLCWSSVSLPRRPPAAALVLSTQSRSEAVVDVATADTMRVHCRPSPTDI